MSDRPFKGLAPCGVALLDTLTKLLTSAITTGRGTDAPGGAEGDMTMRRRLVPAALVAALPFCLGAKLALAEGKASLPPQFTGCYRTPDWAGDGTTCRQPTEQEIKAWDCPGGGILVDAHMWTTFEDYTCDIKNVSKKGDGFLVGQWCGGEGHYEAVREFWQLHKIAGLTLLVKTSAKTLKSEILVRCRGNNQVR
jgi:hypothetical protein